MNTNKPMTVFDLSRACAELIVKGLGGKHILITQDDEANGYHALWFGFEDDQETINKVAEYDMFHDNDNPKDVVLLG